MATVTTVARRPLESSLPAPRARIGMIIPSANSMTEPQFNYFAPPGLGVHVARDHFPELHQYHADRSDRGYRAGPRQTCRQQQSGGALGLPQATQIGVCSASADAVAWPADAAHGCMRTISEGSST